VDWEVEAAAAVVAAALVDVGVEPACRGLFKKEV
jgi:hypothetical protein